MGDGEETARYLPKETKDKHETGRKKREGSKKGEQYVADTEEPKRARKEAHAAQGLRPSERPGRGEELSQ